MTKIIAELCQNHNGDLKILDEMVAAAAEAKADYVKIQSMRSSDLAFRKRFEKEQKEIKLSLLSEVLTNEIIQRRRSISQI